MIKRIVAVMLFIGGHASAQLQNLDFEVCDTSVEQPINGLNCRHLEGWTLGGTAMGSGFGFSIGNGGVSTAQNGSMALQLSVWYTYSKDEAFQQVPFTAFPESLNGYYMYTDNVVSSIHNPVLQPDSASVVVLLSKWNSASGQRDTIGYGKRYLGEATTYTAFSCPIQYVSSQSPDSILIHLDCSRIPVGSVVGSMWGNSSNFTVDNLSLNDNALQVKEPAEQETWVAHPNPGNGQVQLPGFSGSVEVLDLNGKCVFNQAYSENVVNITTLPDGVYLLKLTDQLNRTSNVKYLKQ